MSGSIDLQTPLSASETSRSLWFTADALLGQCSTLLTDTITSNEQLAHQSKLIPGSTIGKHLRHLFDHFRLALEGLAASPSSSADPISVNYDSRTRNMASETDVGCARDAFESLRSQLKHRTREGTAVDGKRVVRLRALTPECVEVESSWDRELWFCGLHATHHLALLRVIATGELGLELPADFGVAPSTLSYRAGEVAKPGSPSADHAKL